MARVSEGSVMAGPGGGAPNGQLQGTLSVDASGQAILWQGRPLDLSPTEAAVLAHLARHAGQTVPFAALLQAAWGTSLQQGGSLEQVRAAVKRLRRKLGRATGASCRIANVRGIGYRLEFAPVAHQAQPRRPRLPGIVKALVAAGFILVAGSFLWRQPPADPHTMVWYGGEQMPAAALHLTGHGLYCAAIGDQLWCYDTPQELLAATGTALAHVDPQTPAEPHYPASLADWQPPQQPTIRSWREPPYQVRGLGLPTQ